MMERRRFSLVAAAAGIAVLGLTLSCRDQSGPGSSLTGRFSIRPVFEAAGIVPLAEARLTLERSADQTLVADTVVDLDPADTTVDLSLTVMLQSPTETFWLRVWLIGPQGDTVFRGGPVTVAPSTGGGVPVIDVPLGYEGVGKDAQSVTIVTTDILLLPGDSVLLDAVALDSLGQPLVGTPVEWTLLSGPATVTALGEPTYRARVVGVSPGPVLIVARLLTDQADTVAFPVLSQGGGQLWSTGNDGTEAITIDVTTGAGTLVGRFGTSETWAAAFAPNGTLYTLAGGFSGNAVLATVNQSTGQASLIGQGVGTSMISLEFDAAGTLYGIGYDDAILYRIDPVLGTATGVGPTAIGATMDLAFNSAGTLYATTGDQLWTVNPATGAATSLGSVTGACPGGEIMAIMFDPADILYATNYADAASSCLMVVNLATMTATPIGLTGQVRPHGGDFR